MGETARFYDDIRLKHGRVIEYYADSDIVIVDIGSTVNVNNGDLYQVFFPPFSGDEDCISDDGRSKRKIGSYIPIHSAKIQVLHVQEQISTCVVVGRETVGIIPTGALLKRIPNGTTPTFIPQRHYGSPLNSHDEISPRIHRMCETGDLCAVLNIAPSINVEPLLVRERALSEFVDRVRMIFPSGTEIFLASGRSFYLVLQKWRDWEDASKVRAEIENRLNRLIKFGGYNQLSAGIYLYKEDADYEQSVKSLLHYARAALLVAIPRSRESLRLSYFRPESTIHAWRSARNVDEALADYHAFKRYGLAHPLMENHLGLAMLNTDDVRQLPSAEIALTIAHNTVPSDPAIKANLALIKVHTGDFAEAFRLFGELEQFLFVKNRAVSYALAYGKCAIEMHGDAKVSPGELSRVIEKILTHVTTVRKRLVYQNWLSEIRKAGLLSPNDLPN